MNIVALDFETHKVIHKKTYDTNGDKGASAELLKDMTTTLPTYCIIVAGVRDEAASNLSKEVKAFFKTMGSK